MDEKLGCGFFKLGLDPLLVLEGFNIKRSFVRDIS